MSKLKHYDNYTKFDRVFKLNIRRNFQYLKKLQRSFQLRLMLKRYQIMLKILLHFYFLEICIFNMKVLTETMEIENWAERHFWEVLLCSFLRPDC